MFGSMERRECIFNVGMRLERMRGILYVWFKKEDKR